MADTDDWTFDPDYEGRPVWWHEDCPTPTVLPGGSQIGGVAGEQRVKGHFVGVLCMDCGAVLASASARLVRGD